VVPWTRAALEELGRRLPSDDAVLDAWLGEVVARREEWVFRKLVFAALGSGRSLQAKHLREGAVLFENSEQLRLSVARFSGDLGAALVAAVGMERLGGESQAVALALAAMWCRERNGGNWTPGLLAAARRLARLGFSSPPVALALAIVCAATRDPGLQSLLEPRPVPWVAGFELVFWEQAQRDLWNCVPVEASPHVVTGYTVRRAVARVGRNEPCPCGSGRKYKHCCLSKDQERLRQSSAVPGLTVQEWREQPELGLTLRRLREMSSYEVARLDPGRVPRELREHLLDQLISFREFESAVRCLEQTEPEHEGDWFYWEWVFTEVVRMGDRALAKRLLALRPVVELSCLGVGARLLMAGNADPEGLAIVEEEVRRCLRKEAAVAGMAELAHDLLASRAPGLGLIVARGVLPLMGPLDAESLLLAMHETRARLDLGMDEPMEEIYQLLLEGPQDGGEEESGELDLARGLLQVKADEVRKLKSELEVLQQDLRVREERMERIDVGTALRAPVPADGDGVNEREVGELRSKLRDLRERLKERHAERNQLRRELLATRQELAHTSAQEQRSASREEGVPQPEVEPLFEEVEPLGQQPLRWLEWPHKFREELTRFPRPVAKSVLLLAARLAAGEAAAFVGMKRLRRAPDVYRQRVAAHYRLLFRLEGETIRILDLVDRKDLERVIKERL